MSTHLAPQGVHLTIQARKTIINILNGITAEESTLLPKDVVIPRPFFTLVEENGGSLYWPQYRLCCDIDCDGVVYVDDLTDNRDEIECTVEEAVQWLVLRIPVLTPSAVYSDSSL